MLDCYHLQKYGRSVTKDVYKKLPQGPVPSDTYDRLKSIVELRDITEEFYPSINAEENSIVDLKFFVKDKVSEKEYSEIEYIEKVTDAMTLNYG